MVSGQKSNSFTKTYFCEGTLSALDLEFRLIQRSRKLAEGKEPH